MSMNYTIRHVTRFTYETAISESVMEARMQPRSEGAQRCIRFGLSTAPPSRVRMYQDHDGNVVHHFNIPGHHARLSVTAEALVECDPAPAAAPGVTWKDLDDRIAPGEFWEVLSPSPFARRTPRLDEFAREIGLRRGDDPFSTLLWLNGAIYQGFEYSPQSTRVDSPIDDALSARRGVCQDFSHIMIALARQLGVPCRYVSGYVFQNPEARSARRSSDGATHAWVEAWLPDLGWIGFDPTNNLLAGDRHIRVALGRDYADVPPTRGVFKGTSAVRSELAVAVSVGTAQIARADEAVPFVSWLSREAVSTVDSATSNQQRQQQQ
jgi:transglutaminase-like putative cysteine protease